MAVVLRILSAMLAGGLLLLPLMIYHYGLWQRALGMTVEPQAGFPPFRWHEIRPDRPVRVLLVGTSLTAQTGWSDHLHSQLSSCRPAGVTVERLAKPGANSRWGLAALTERLATGPAPDLMVIEFSINDASLWRGMTIGKSRERHMAMLDLAAKAGIVTWLATMSPAYGRDALERPGQIAYRGLYFELAREYELGLMAHVPLWQRLSADQRRLAIPDNLHPTRTVMENITVPAMLDSLAAVLCVDGAVPESR
jgi:lysophospholipase L1-like esterase